ncbi:MAG TPA: DUF4215 domain-containing protein [Myxococcota bacterium]|jgi:cysteine-rich repeat protein|nr:DUF4215 domain-containing protein [Myxococcota bacterium]
MRLDRFSLCGALALSLVAGLGTGCPHKAVCGDGTTETPETCDDSNTQSGDGCSASCQTEAAMCGNGVVDTGEQCDDGAMNSNVTPDACRVSCMLPFCGDAVVDTAAGETCDPPGMTCSTTCVALAGVCGDGMVQPGEGCDDGNTVAGDGCDATCQPEPFMCPTTTPVTCGVAGSVNGTLSATGGVVADYCGGQVNMEDGSEQVFEFAAATSEDVIFSLTGLTGDLDILVTDSCDPDACVSGSLAGGTADEAAPATVVAGTTYFLFVDGYGGMSGAFTLTAGCASTAACGNGIPEPGEACDDGNAVGGDGCTAACLLETDASMCTGDVPPPITLSGTPTLVDFGNVGAGTDTGQLSCNNTGVGCSGAGAEIVAELVMPMGTTDLVMDYDHTGGDELYGVTTDTGMACVELECMDPFAVMMGSKTGSWTFAGVSDGLADTTVFLIAEACDAGGASGVATTAMVSAM